MFKKKDLVIVELTAAEKRLTVLAVIRFRNKLIALNKPIEDVNSIILRLL